MSALARSSSLVVALMALTPALLLLGEAPARACSCIPTPPPVEAARATELVFEGTLVSVADAPKTSPHSLPTKIWTMEVGRTWKGQLDAQVNIHSAASGTACGRFYGDPGVQWLIFASVDDQGTIRDSACSASKRIADASEDIEALDAAAGTLDQPPAESEPEPEPPPPQDEEPPVVTPVQPLAPEPSKKGCALANDPSSGALALLLVGMLGLGLGRRRAGSGSR